MRPGRDGSGDALRHLVVREKSDTARIPEAFMATDLKVGDRVSWNSEAGRVTGVIKKKITSATHFKNYMVHASKEEPQYLIRSEKTEHLAVHKGRALRKLRPRRRTG